MPMPPVVADAVLSVESSASPEVAERNACASFQMGFRIPNLVHYTFCTDRHLPEKIKRIVAHNKAVCKNCEFKFYDDEDCDAFIRTHFRPHVYAAYRKINPVYGAMRADFFRYCCLYVLGGIYVDIKSIIHTPVFSLIRRHDTCLLDLPRNDAEPWRRHHPTHEQWLLIFAPRHPYLLAMIAQMTHDILNECEPCMVRGTRLSTKGKILHVTGPDAFSRTIREYLAAARAPPRHRCIDYTQYFRLNDNTTSYHQMYTNVRRVHYSLLSDPLYVRDANERPKPKPRPSPRTLAATVPF